MPPAITRSFICIDFPDSVIKEVARIQSILSKKQFTGKLTELENLHLTLKFLGHLSPEKLNKVKSTLSKIKFSPLYLRISHLGTFSYKNTPRIVWIKVTGKVFDLQKQIDKSLSPLFPKEARFMSHLTIARIKYVKNKSGFKDYIKNLSLSQIKFPCNSFKLKSSELQPSGPIYNTLNTYKSSHLK